MSKKLIVVAEDETAYGSLLKLELEKQGYRVVLTFNGDDFLTAIRHQKPDLTLLDLVMPIKNGFEALSEMKKDQELKDIKVIVLSNLGQDEEIERVKKIGVNDYLVKSDEEFYNVIEKIKKLL